MPSQENAQGRPNFLNIYAQTCLETTQSNMTWLTDSELSTQQTPFDSGTKFFLRSLRLPLVRSCSRAAVQEKKEILKGTLDTQIMAIGKWELRNALTPLGHQDFKEKQKDLVVNVLSLLGLPTNSLVVCQCVALPQALPGEMLYLTLWSLVSIHLQYNI